MSEMDRRTDSGFVPAHRRWCGGGDSGAAVCLFWPDFTLNDASTSRDGSHSSSKDYIAFSCRKDMVLHS